MEKEVISLPAELLAEVGKLRTAFNENVFNAGDAFFEEKRMHEALDELEKVKETIVSDRIKLVAEEQKLIQTIREQYGDGVLDIEKGTFTKS